MRPEFPGNHPANPGVTFPDGAAPSWPAVRERLARHGLVMPVRMIDGQPAFPDEEPPEGWRELRVAAGDGMVTVRREENRVTFVTWDNAGPAVRRAVNGLAWAFADVGTGRVDAPEGAVDAAAFLRVADLPEGFGAG